ncbi:hypothetical protein [Enterococcus sp. JM9B]|uniref:hypothetical protein n=1 Tax=Enterococcus sp. JM9B TaxID=1857216 RepID=UPI001374ADA5|nr:hypothetical protein [Enterococcus sp. JM9B]KAF1303670.1 hypothetical protein BAU16_03645 [Enterococcus sp. JM9B]
MDKTTANNLADANLVAFKERMQIYSSSRDGDIKRMLATSFQEIENLIGSYDPDNDLYFIDLVFQRTRYDFNDKLEFFKANFQSDILDLSLIYGEVITDDSLEL